MNNEPRSIFLGELHSGHRGKPIFIERTGGHGLSGILSEVHHYGTAEGARTRIVVVWWPDVEIPLDLGSDDTAIVHLPHSGAIRGP
ncbi:hypothetical protein BJF90_04990 [Pseudonocardia sp. CNS-004]|nr:hypothetical protein BJF90_04990 [Pseudonocardia sp. CNS-004]